MGNRPDRVTFQNRLNEMIQTIRHDILTSKLSAGDFIPSELTLAKQYNISRKSVRKGLDILVAEGLLKKIPRVGNMVNPPADYQKVTINLGYYSSLERECALPDLLELFHTKYPHIQVEAIPLPYHNYVPAAREFMNNGWLDVITLNNKDYCHALEQNALEMFQPLEKQPEQYPFLAPLFIHHNQLLVQPLVFSPVVLCYNKSLFRQMGIPEPDSNWSWEDLSKTAVKFSESTNLLGFYADIASINRFPIFLLQNNVKFKRNAKGYQFRDPMLWKCLLTFRDLFYNQGKPPAFLSEADEDTEKLFLQQKTAMILTTYFGMNIMKDPDFEYDIAPVPHDSSPKTMLLVTGLAISRQSKHKEAAKLLVDFLASAACQLYIRKHTLSIPAHKPSAEWTGPEHIYRPARFFSYRNIIPTFRSYKDLNISIAVLEKLQKELKLFWSNLEQPDSVIRRMEEHLTKTKPASESIL